MKPRYFISYSKVDRLVVVHPDNKSAGSNVHEIGEFRVEPNADFEDYQADLEEAIRRALGRVGESDPSTFNIRIHDMKTGEITKIDAENDPPAPLPQEDQVPVSEETTAAEAELEESTQVHGSDEEE